MHFLLLKLIVTVIHFCLQKRVEDFSFFFKSTMYLLKTFSCKLNRVSIILKSKESPLLSVRKGSVSHRPGFIDKNDHVISLDKDLLSQVS